MNARGLNIILLAICLGLVGTLGFTLYLLWQEPHPETVEKPVVISNTVTQKQITVRKVGTADLLATLANFRPLTWAAIESTNYYHYMMKLRAFGCPDETIQDIILTDVAKLYSRRRSELMRGQAYSYWKPDGWNVEQDSEVRRALRELEAEQDHLISELLGVDFKTEMARYWGGDELERTRSVGYLASEKQEGVLEIRRRYEREEEAIYAASQGILLEKDRMRLQELEREREAELAALLTADELENYQLRNSATAVQLREDLGGFDVTEAEFRALYGVNRTFADQFENSFDPNDPVAMEIKERAELAARDALEQEISKVLGPERYSEYVRGQDEDYQQLVRLSDRLNLSGDIAARVYEMKQDAVAQKLQVEANVNLTEEQRSRALAAMAREVEKSVAKVMGTDNFEAYRRSGEAWISGLMESEQLVVAAPQEAGLPPLPALPPLPPARQ